VIDGRVRFEASSTSGIAVAHAAVLVSEPASQQVRASE